MTSEFEVRLRGEPPEPLYRSKVVMQPENKLDMFLAAHDQLSPHRGAPQSELQQHHGEPRDCYLGDVGVVRQIGN